MATQSERLGYELAKWMGVQTPQVLHLGFITQAPHLQTQAIQTILLPYSFSSINWKVQARVIHNTCLEWQQIKEASEKAREAANSEGDEIGEVTCFELLEALELSRCLFFMRYDSL